MNKKLIFIHIPKTGGTSINCEINQSEWQTTPDFNYRHIDYKSKKSNSADIFDPKNIEKYQEHKIFFFLRDPIDRLFSEYYFLKPRMEFMQLLPRNPRSFYEYCKFKNTNNSVIKFLLGYKMFSNPILTEELYDSLIKQIETLDIKIGIFENYLESLAYLENELGVKWSNVIEKKRITIDKPSALELTEEQFEEIKILNELDYRLYNYAVNKIQTNLDAITKIDIALSGSRYDYIQMYTQRFVLIETQFTGSGSNFIKQNKNFFAQLNLSLHNKKTYGKDYVKEWNSKFRTALQRAISDLKLSEEVANIPENSSDPLVTSFELAKTVNQALNRPIPSKIERLK
ncbi:MAG: sulfotransferase family 2 domain-containing protein [Flavobacteriales bacterium]|nr:sulfotransferase family 2 domain-containing protein [Flavobacteriales bacterium]MCB9198402.1 sulfotransferase family 2 domain-containing protein [Flavobacteriales bacterium]